MFLGPLHLKDVSLVNYRTTQPFWQMQRPLSIVIIPDLQSSHLLEIGGFLELVLNN
jgi:hypothetical protein